MEHQSNTILVVDDEEHILELIRFNLEREGYRVITLESGSQVMKTLETQTVDLLLLDLMLSDADGIEICKQIRKNTLFQHLPIIMLTAKSEEIDRILGLELGADDYITKPFSVKELTARIKSLLRRTNISITPKETIISWRDLKIDLDKHLVSVREQEVDLTLKEFELLRLLLLYRGKVMSRNYLLDEIWGYDYFGETRTVDVHIRNVRRKLEPWGLEDMIETVRGVGYKIR